MITTIVSVAVAAAHQEKVGVSSRELVREYVAMHSVATAELVSSVRKAPCARRFISADFWGRGLGNSVNTPLNALALAIATNRTLLISTDKQYEAGFWRYLGDLAWARECRLVAWLTCGTGKDEVLEAFRAARGCEQCGCLPAPHVVRDFFPMNSRCLRESTCGDGVKWLLCEPQALSRDDAPFVHIRGAVTWLAPLVRERTVGNEAVQQRAQVLFSYPNVWGLLYDALVSRQPLNEPNLPLSQLLSRKRASLPGRVFDIGIHIRHRQFQPIEDIERNAAACLAIAIRDAEPSRTVFIATELPSRLPKLVAALQAASGREDLVYDFINVSAVPERHDLSRVARTNRKSVRRDWGEFALDRWLCVADFYLLASSKLLIGTLSSTFSELAAVAGYPRTRAFLYDPIFQITGPARSQPRRRKWPAADEYLTEYGPHFKCIRADSAWPLPQYIRLRPATAHDWILGDGCRPRL